jgi:hypothetical protein
MPVYTKTLTDVQVRSVELGGVNEITTTVAVQRIDRAFINIDVEISAIQNENHIPELDEAYATAASGMLWERYAVCRSISYRVIGGGRAVVFTCVYSTQFAEDPSARGTFILPSRTDYVARVRSTNIFRTGWSVAPSNTNASADIGGTAVSNGTAAKSEQVPQLQIRVSLTSDAFTNPMTQVATLSSSFMDRINSAAFAGFPAGTLVCEGFSVQKNGNGINFYDVVYEFLYDQWFHLEQVCDTDEKGYPILNSSQAPKTVKWKRVARNTADFNDLFKVGGTIDTAWQRRTLQGW